ncbi:MAG: hydrogenase maturation nickel metallochaperone HypA [Chloroflexota bacterium]
MHEMAVTQSILNIALDHAERAGATRVSDLYLLVGQLSSIVDDSVQFYWDIISKETICEGAQLHFERVPAQMVCLDCGEQYVLTGGLTECPACGSFHVHVSGGEEFRLESIEVETAAEAAARD